MKITCTLSEYTKMARQCGETKARFNCRACPLNGLLELPEGEKCDIECFVQTINMPDTHLAKAILERKAFHKDAPKAVAEAIKSEILFGAGGERLESR